MNSPFLISRVHQAEMRPNPGFQTFYPSGDKKTFKMFNISLFLWKRNWELFYFSYLATHTPKLSTFLQKMETFRHFHEIPNKLANHFKRWNLLNLKHLKIYIQTNLKADSLDCVILTHVHARCLILKNDKQIRRYSQRFKSFKICLPSAETFRVNRHLYNTYHSKLAVCTSPHHSS